MIEQAAALALASTLAVLAQLVYATTATSSDAVVNFAIFAIGVFLGAAMISLADRMTCARRQRQGSRRRGE